MMKRLDNPRIVYVKDFDEALELIKREYAPDYPIYVRGITTSIGKSLRIPKDQINQAIEFAGGYPKDFIIKNIEGILKEGTERDFEADLLRGEDGLYTMVDWITEHRDPFQARSAAKIYREGAIINIGELADRFLTSKERTMLRPAVLVYDKTLLKLPGNYVLARLPEDKNQRAKVILKAYIIESEQKN